ncbi:MAG: hypothetical protein HYR91_08755 [Flavobacteriia bacterium]|nr:hypothetical protein [Flavobacteriia bacterium]
MVILVFILTFIFQLQSQVTVTGANAASNGTYTLLSSAFNAINIQSQVGKTIVVTITSNIAAEDGAIALGAGVWTSLTIKPSGVRTVTGNVSGWGMLEFDGSDNVTIDGLNDGTNSLSISNTSTNTSSSTIKYYDDASNNILINCTVLGSALGDAATLGSTANGGTVVIGDGTTTGNDNITIQNNNIGPAGANLPSCAIRGYHATASWSTSNNGILISGNNIYNYFNAGSYTSSGIYVGAFNTDWTINNNKFYQTATRTQTTGKRHSAIFLSVNYNAGFVQTGSSYINSFTITNNIIGYASSSSTGTYSIVGVSNTLLDLIYLCVGDYNASCATNIQGNTIAAISLTGSQSGTETSAPLKLIHIYKGNVNVGTTTGNTFGSQTTTGNIVYSTSAATISNIYGILADSYSTGATIAIKNNTFGSITATNTNAAPTSSSIYVISSGSTVNAITYTIQSNTIGGTIANSIQNTTSVAAANTTNTVVGIFVSTTASSITENTIRNLTATGGIGIGSNGPLTSISSVIGIAVRNAYVHTITHNTIYALTNTKASDATVVTGIELTQSGAGTIVNRNSIRSLTVSNATGIINGINISNTSAAVNFENNMISLGKFEDGTTSITVGCSINGINETSTTTVGNTFYYNSIYITGIGVASSLNTYAFYSNKGSVSKTIKNNIFVNNRNNSSGAAKNYCARVVNNTSLTIDYNDYYFSGSGSSLGLYNATDNSTLAAWKTILGGVLEANAINFSPIFISNNDLHLNAAGNSALQVASPIAGLTVDVDPDSRSASTPTIGADEIPIVLSVSLLDFTGDAIELVNKLNWSTSTEENCNQFIIEKSSNGINWEVLAIQKGAGNSTNIQKYSLIDNNPEFETTYYRLTQIDFDGKSNYCKTISIRRKVEAKIGVYPNPTNGEFKVEILNLEAEKLVITLLNCLGEVVVREIIENPTYTSYLINKDLKEGTYFIVIQSNDEIIYQNKIVLNLAKY